MEPSEYLNLCNEDKVVPFCSLQGEFIETVSKYDCYDSVGINLSMLIFRCKSGNVYVQCHLPECSEHVYIEDICGDISDLTNTEILVAREDFNEKDMDTAAGDHVTWTFYNLTTYKGHVTIRWFGASNGYYSETAQLFLVKSCETK